MVLEQFYHAQSTLHSKSPKSKACMAGDDKNKNKGEDDGSTLDHNSPYYLHPSDYPRQMNVKMH